MPVETNNDLESFNRFLEKQLKNGDSTLTPEQALAMWRERCETIDSVHRGLNDVDAGRTRAADEVLSQLRDELEDK